MNEKEKIIVKTLLWKCDITRFLDIWKTFCVNMKYEWNAMI